MQAPDDGAPQNVHPFRTTKPLSGTAGQESTAVGTEPTDEMRGDKVEISLKDYVDAHDEKTRAQNQAQFAEVLSGLKQIDARITSVSDHVSTLSAYLGGRLNVVDERLSETKQAAQRAEDASKSLKWNILFGLLGLAGLLLSLAALWAQGLELLSGAVSTLQGIVR